MRKRLTTFLSVATLVGITAFADNPVARTKSTVVSGNARFTVLTPEMVRIEYSPTSDFEDRATFAIVNRDLPTPGFKKKEDKRFLYLTTDKLSLRYRKGSDIRNCEPADSNLVITMELNGKPVVWYPGLQDDGNLKGTTRTLDSQNGDNKRRELEDGILSRSGWAVIDDSPSATRGDGSRSLAFEPVDGDIDWVAERKGKDALDLYFMGYGHDYKRALGDFTKVAGKIPLPPLYVFGYWYSKYSAYSADDYRKIMKDLTDNEIPTDVLILDMDWHWNGDKNVSGGRGGWTGWTWNTNLIPDPEGLLSDIHSSGLRTALNLHPADGVRSDEDFYGDIAADLGFDTSNGNGIPWMLENRDFYKSFFKNIIRAREGQGVDFWWLDWQQNLLNPRVDGLGETFWCNHVFFNEMKRSRPDRRPVIFHRWGGLGSHRYQIGFSGDAYINFPTLAFQPYFTATASNVGYAYWGHDLGGHMNPNDDPNDPERFLRWVQFGVFTPIFRTHASSAPVIERRMWVYPNFSDFRDAVRLRYSLLPYIYTMARKTYDTGVGIVRPLYYEHPETEAAYARENEYYFGDDILVAPVVDRSDFGTSHKNVWLPEGNWWSVSDCRIYEGCKDYDMTFTLQQIPYFLKEGSIIPRNPASVMHAMDCPDHIVLDIVSSDKGEGALYEDAGDSNNYPEEYAVTTFCQRRNGDTAFYSVLPRKGKFEGMPTQRGYKMNVYNSGVPVSVKIGGKESDNFEYNKETNVTTMDIPTVKSSEGVEVEVKYAN